MDELESITALKKGDLSGLEELVRRHQVEAVQIAYLVVGDRPLAEDIAQASFLKAAEKIHQFDPDRDFRPWFLRIVTNDAIKASSRSKRQLSLDLAQEAAVAPDWLHDPNPGPEELANTAETRRMVWESMQQLTPKQRAAIVMRYFLDMKDREISRELDRPLSSVKWSIHAAKQRLRSLLGQQDARVSQASSKSNIERGAGEEK